MIGLRVSTRHARTLTGLLLLVAAATARGDDSPLGLADLADYRLALRPMGDRDGRPKAVSFRELWDHPQAYQQKRIQVEGRIVRRFHQGAIGTFPPLVEAWAVTPSGDPFCWVYPASERESPTIRGSVRFVGTYLRRIRYQGADVDRLAPLIVGPQPPSSPPQAATRPTVRSGRTAIDWILAAAAAGVVVAVLVWQHLKKPLTRTSMLELGPAPRFDDMTPPDESVPRDEGQDGSIDGNGDVRP